MNAPQQASFDIIPDANDDKVLLPHLLLRTDIFNQASDEESVSQYRPLKSADGTHLSYQGPALKQLHKLVFCWLYTQARDRSLTKGISFNIVSLLRVLGMTGGGLNYQNLDTVLDELQRAKLKTGDPALLRRLLNKSSYTVTRGLPDGEFLTKFMAQRMDFSLFQSSVGAMANYEIDFCLIERKSRNESSGAYVVSMDPLLCLLFEYETSTARAKDIVALDTWEQRIHDLLITFAGEGLAELPVGDLYEIFGLKAENWERDQRKFRHQLKKSLTSLSEKGMVSGDWEIIKKAPGSYTARGLCIEDYPKSSF